MTYSRLCITALLVLAFSACTTSGRRIDDRRVAQIQIGTTSQAQVRAWFGEPSSREVSPSRGSTWTYAYQRAAGADTRMLGSMAAGVGTLMGGAPMPIATPVGAGRSSNESQTLQLEFDAAGKVVDYEYFVDSAATTGFH